MISKGNARGGGQQLAAHLMNAFDNDRAELLDLRGAIAPDLSGAFAEWHAQSKLTNCRKYLYSLSLNPDHRQGEFTREQYHDFIARAEKRLGLAGQPRAVVVHVKHGREHFHVVWSRIDGEKGRAVQLSHDRQKLRKTAQEFARDHGIELPAGMREDKGKDRFEDRKKRADLHEKQQEERTGLTKAERVRNITDAWNTTRTGEEFLQALAKMDYFVAQGDRRGFVVVDLAGEVHSLARQIEGAKTRDLKARLKDLSPGRLKDVATAQAHAKTVREQRSHAPAREGPTPAQRRAQLQERQQLRRLAVDLDRHAMLDRHAKERAALAMHQGNLLARITAERQGRKAGVLGFLRRVTGIELVAGIIDKGTDRDRAQDNRRQAAALELRQHNETFENDRALRVLDRLDKREQHAIKIALQREEFQRVAGPHDQEKEKEKAKQKAPRLTLGEPEAVKDKGLAAIFNRIAQQREQTRPPEKPLPGKGEPEKTGTLREAFQKAVEEPVKETAPEPETGKPGGSLTDLFRRLARGREPSEPTPGDPGREKHFRPAPADPRVRR